MSRLAAFAVATIAATVLATTLAEAAQTRRYQKRTIYQGRTVYVTPRSFLDPGNVVPIGTEARTTSISANTTTRRLITISCASRRPSSSPAIRVSRLAGQSNRLAPVGITLTRRRENRWSGTDDVSSVTCCQFTDCAYSPALSSLTMASPISRVRHALVPADAMSLVRRPDASTAAMAASTLSAALAEAERIAQRHAEASRSWRSGWRGPCRRCRARSRGPARRAPCACRSWHPRRRARPTAACRASRSASRRRPTARRRTGCR